MSVKIDARLFSKRARLLMSVLGDSNLDCPGLLVLTGGPNDELPYQKSTSLQTWLLGFEFTDTAIFATKDQLVFFTSAKKGTFAYVIKADILKPLEGGKVAMKIIERSKNAEEAQSKLKEFVAEIIKSGKVVGNFQKDKFSGKFYDQVRAEIDAASVEYKDMGNLASDLLAVKDEDELKSAKLASRMTSQVMKKYFIEELEQILDQDKKITHEKLSSKVESILQDEKYFQRMGFPSDVSIDYTEWCYTPIVQSSPDYDLRVSAVSNDKNLHPSTIIASMGVRYKSYCSNISRTFLIDPPKQREKNYKFLTEVHDYLLSVCKPGAACKDVWEKVTLFVEKKREDLKAHLIKSFGFGMGLEFRDSTYSLSSKNSNILKAGMVLNLTSGFQNIPIPEAKDEHTSYSLLLADTVQITDTGCVLLTNVNRDLSEVSYMFKDNEEEVTPKETAKTKQASTVLTSKTRGEERDVSAEQRRREHQKQLALQKQQEGLERFSQGSDVRKAEKAVFRRFESYKKESQLPTSQDLRRILVDRKNETVLLPIFGISVPFHISTIKNVSKSDEGDYVYLRFNFVTPGQTLGKKENTVFEDANSTFVRALSFKSADVFRFNEVYRQVSDLKKESSKRELERKEMADLVVQDKLIEVKGRRPIRLQDISLRPAMEGKRVPGDLEIHVNGLRYISQLRSDQKVDILFSNIKHLFFQPCDGELVILLHVHLKNHIMIGKKKTKDVQFYREVNDATFDETGNKKRRFNYGDEDELEAEQEERRRRVALNKEFKEFAERIADVSKMDVDVPFRSLGFNGVPFRQLVLMQPTSNCLVHLSDPPFFVVDLSEVEICHLERVQFGLKNFDMVFVLKDFSKPVIHVNTIPMEQLDLVKDWLDSMDVAFNEGLVNLNWTQIMKTVNEDPAGFFADGGWAFLHPDSDEEGSAMSESGSEFEEEVASEEESESESDFSEGASEDYESGSGSGSESGQDWDELEKRAEKSDNKKREREEESIGSKKFKR